MTLGRVVSAAEYILCGFRLRSESSERDLEIVVTTSVNIHEQTDRTCTSARRMLEAIKWSFDCVSTTAFRILDATHARLRLE